MTEALLAAVTTACSGENFLVSTIIDGEITVEIPSHCLREAVKAGIAQQGWLHLSAITAQQDPVGIQLLYHFWQQGGLTLRITCPSDELAVPSLTDLLPVADWYEREVRDMFGIEFIGHPNPVRLLLPDDWQEPPPMRVQDTIT